MNVSRSVPEKGHFSVLIYSKNFLFFILFFSFDIRVTARAGLRVRGYRKRS